MHRVMVGCPVRDRAWILPRYLAHLCRLRYPRELLSLCFVVNDSTDGTHDLLQQFAEAHRGEYRRVKLVVFDQGAIKDARRRDVRLQIFSTLASARNRLLEELTDEDYLFSVDSDVLVPPEALAALLACRKDIVAARVWNDRARTAPNFLCRGSRWYLHPATFPEHELFEVDVTGAVYLLSREVARQVRYGYHPQGEDVYFSEQARKAGFRLWVNPEVHCEHVLAPEEGSLSPAAEGAACSTS